MKIVPKLKKGKKLLKGEEGTPVVISHSEYGMTPEGQFILLDLNGKWLFFDDMATRDSLEYQWYPHEDVAPASAFSNGVPNRKDPYYVKAQKLAEQQKKTNKSEKKANKSEKKEKGGIMKGLDDLDTFNIAKESKKLPKKNPVYTPNIIRDLKPEYELPEGTFQGEPGFFVGSDTIPSLQDRGFEVSPPLSEGQKAIKKFKDRFKKRTIGTPLAYKKGGIVKGQEDLDTDTDVNLELEFEDPFERARRHNEREAEISRLYFNSTPSIGNLIRGAYHWWMSKPSLGGETGYITGTAPSVGIAKGVGTIKLATRTLSKWRKLNIKPSVRSDIERYMEELAEGNPDEYAERIRFLMKHPKTDSWNNIMSTEKLKRKLDELFATEGYIPLSQQHVRSYIKKADKLYIEGSYSGKNPQRSSKSTASNWFKYDHTGE